MSGVDGLQAGSRLPVLKKQISQERINRYAGVSRDFNPIHIDEEFAKKTPLGGTIAHGMMVLAYLSQIMTDAFGRDWLSSGELNVRFKAPARPGDTITVSGTVRSVDKGDAHTLVDCDISCRNQSGEEVITGDAKVRLKGDENSG